MSDAHQGRVSHEAATGCLPDAHRVRQVSGAQALEGSIRTITRRCFPGRAGYRCWDARMSVNLLGSATRARHPATSRCDSRGLVA